MGADVVRRIYQAWREGDLDALSDLLHPDVELDMTARVLNPDTYEGHAGVQRWTESLRSGPCARARRTGCVSARPGASAA